MNIVNKAIQKVQELTASAKKMVANKTKTRDDIALAPEAKKLKFDDNNAEDMVDLNQPTVNTKKKNVQKQQNGKQQKNVKAQKQPDKTNNKKNDANNVQLVKDAAFNVNLNNTQKG